MCQSEVLILGNYRVDRFVYNDLPFFKSLEDTYYKQIFFPTIWKFIPLKSKMYHLNINHIIVSLSLLENLSRNAENEIPQ